MATVYITNELTSRVTSVISRMKEAEIDSNDADVSKTITEDCHEFLSHAMWGQHQHLATMIPEEWLSNTATPTLEVNVPAPNDDTQDFRKSYRMHFKCDKPIFNRPSNDRWSAPTIQCTKEYVEANRHMEGASVILEQIERFERNHEIQSKWNKVSQDIAVYLGKCKSLNEALKLWPGVKLYIPSEYIRRVEMKVERKVREKTIVAETPTDTLTAAAIAAKLSGITA